MENTDYQEILQDCDNECENANVHEMNGLATDIFDDIRTYIDKKHYTKVATKIRDCILRKI